MISNDPGFEFLLKYAERFEDSTVEDLLQLHYEEILEYKLPPHVTHKLWDALRIHCCGNDKDKESKCAKKKRQEFHEVNHLLEENDLLHYTHNFHASALTVEILQSLVDPNDGIPKSIKSEGIVYKLTKMISSLIKKPTQSVVDHSLPTPAVTHHSTATRSSNWGTLANIPNVRWWEFNSYCQKDCLCNDVMINQAKAGIDLFVQIVLRQNTDFLALPDLASLELINILMGKRVITPSQKQRLMAEMDLNQRSKKLLHVIKARSKSGLFKFLQALYESEYPFSNYLVQCITLGFFSSFSSSTLVTTTMTRPSTGETILTTQRLQDIPVENPDDEDHRIYENVLQLFVNGAPITNCRMANVVNCAYFQIFSKLNFLRFHAHDVEGMPPKMAIVNFDGTFFKNLATLELENVGLSEFNLKLILNTIQLDTLVVKNEGIFKEDQMKIDEQFESLLTTRYGNLKTMHLQPIRARRKEKVNRGTGFVVQNEAEGGATSDHLQWQPNSYFLWNRQTDKSKLEHPMSKFSPELADSDDPSDEIQLWMQGSQRSNVSEFSRQVFLMDNPLTNFGNGCQVQKDAIIDVLQPLDRYIIDPLLLDKNFRLVKKIHLPFRTLVFCNVSKVTLLEMTWPEHVLQVEFYETFPSQDLFEYLLSILRNCRTFTYYGSPYQLIQTAFVKEVPMQYIITLGHDQLRSQQPAFGSSTGFIFQVHKYLTPGQMDVAEQGTGIHYLVELGIGLVDPINAHDNHIESTSKCGEPLFDVGRILFSPTPVETLKFINFVEESDSNMIFDIVLTEPWPLHRQPLVQSVLDQVELRGVKMSLKALLVILVSSSANQLDMYDATISISDSCRQIVKTTESFESKLKYLQIQNVSIECSETINQYISPLAPILKVCQNLEKFSMTLPTDLCLTAPGLECHWFIGHLASWLPITKRDERQWETKMCEFLFEFFDQVFKINTTQLSVEESNQGKFKTHEQHAWVYIERPDMRSLIENPEYSKRGTPENFESITLFRLNVTISALYYITVNYPYLTYLHLSELEIMNSNGFFDHMNSICYSKVEYLYLKDIFFQDESTLANLFRIFPLLKKLEMCSSRHLFWVNCDNISRNCCSKLTDVQLSKVLLKTRNESSLGVFRATKNLRLERYTEAQINTFFFPTEDDRFDEILNQADEKNVESIDGRSVVKQSYLFDLLENLKQNWCEFSKYFKMRLFYFMGLKSSNLIQPALSQFSNLVKLEVTDCGMSLNDFLCLIFENKVVREIRCYNISLGTDNIEAFCQNKTVEGVNPSVEILNIIGTRLNSSCDMEQLFWNGFVNQILKLCSNLTKLTFDTSYLITFDLTQLDLPNLEYLNMSRLEIIMKSGFSKFPRLRELRMSTTNCKFMDCFVVPMILSLFPGLEIFQIKIFEPRTKTYDFDEMSKAIFKDFDKYKGKYRTIDTKSKIKSLSIHSNSLSLTVGCRNTLAFMENLEQLDLSDVQFLSAMKINKSCCFCHKMPHSERTENKFVHLKKVKLWYSIVDHNYIRGVDLIGFLDQCPNLNELEIESTKRIKLSEEDVRKYGLSVSLRPDGRIRIHKLK